MVQGSGSQLPSSTTRSPPPSTGTPAPQSTVRAQLEQVATALTRAVPAAPEHVIPAAAPVATPGDVKDSKENLKHLELALQALPDGPAFASSRSAIQANIQREKESIRDAKPMGVRMDGARDALARAQNRRAEAAKALELAQATVEAADKEIAEYTANVKELERAIAVAPDVPMEAALDPKDVLTSIEAQLQTLVGTLQSDVNVNPLHTEAAGQHVAALIQGFEKTIELAAAARTAAVPRRLRGKQLPPGGDADDDEDGVEVPRLRHSTKKPLLKQSTLFGHGFTAVRKSNVKPKN